MLRNSFGGTLRACVVAASLTTLSAGSALGQATTGRIQGRVTDEATGAPIAGAEVVVVGTTFGNLTDDDGFYFINGVPAGLRTVRSTSVGYRAIEVTDERILVGHTTKLDFRLEAAPGEPEPPGLALEGRRNPPEPLDRTSTQFIVRGETVDQLPLDDAAGIVVLQPGVVQTDRGPAIRGGRPNEEAVVINGLLSRGFGRGTADNIALPTNALEQVAVNAGAFSAEFGDAQSGVVSYVTRSGGSELTGSFEMMSDQLGPDAWRTNFNRAELTLGGPITDRLTFFLAGTASGEDASTTELAPNRFVIDGADTCDIENFCEAVNGGPGLGAPATFRLPRSSSTPGLSDSVDVTAPRFVEFDNGRTVPHGWSQSGLFHANLNWQLPRGSRVNFSFLRNRDQTMGHAGFGTNFLFDGVDGALGTRNSYALSWFQTLKRTPTEQLALDLLVGYSRDRDTNGMLDQAWWVDHKDPSFGFLTGNLKFAFDDGKRTVTGFDPFDPSDEFIAAYRSNAVPRDSLVLSLGRSDLAATRQSLLGLSANLRSNPYGLATSFPLYGAGNEGLAKSAEDRLQLRGALDWQLGRFNRLRAGAEYVSIALDAFSLPLATGGAPLPETADPRRIGVFFQDRVEFGALVLDGGIRFDHLNTDAEYPIVPGFVFNVPDSLKAGFVRFDPSTGTYAPMFDQPCGGVTPSNPNGTCLNNFVEAETKSEFSPRFGAAYSVSPKSALRMGFGRFVQTPAFFDGLLRNVNLDLQNGSTASEFGRDVDLPSTRIWEIGYRVLLGDDLVVDVSAFDKRRSGALSVRRVQFEDPTTGSGIFLNVLANADAAGSNGFEISLDKSVGRMIDTRLSYSFVDADGADSDPAFPGLRRHNINWTGSLSLPPDYKQGSVAGAILRNLGLFTILRVRSGLPFTELVNQGEGQVGPPDAGGLPSGMTGDASTPWTTAFDLRLTKGFQVGRGLDLVAFVDWRNPFDIENSALVFLETGNEVNELHRARTLDALLSDSRLDGSPDISDFDIRAESPENPFNLFMLLRAEQRFGNGDGIFTVEEQQAAFGQTYENDFGVNSRFSTSDQLMRLGVSIGF